MVYCVRSLVPSEAKDTWPRMAAELSAAEGTSTITPGVAKPASAHMAAKSAASEGVEIIGAMTQTSAAESLAAVAMAESWRASTPGEVVSVR